MAENLISEMQSSERPREKALRNGIKSLSDSELMALIFSTGIKGKGVVALCSEILRDNNWHLSTIASMSAADITERYKGIGSAKALNLLAGIELGIRAAADASRMSHTVVTSSATAYELMKEHLDRLPHEEFWVMYLSRRASVISTRRISQGGMSSTVVDVKIIMRHALLDRASAMILFHNHPSGTLKPSIQDCELTDRIAAAARLMQISLNDHIIVGDNDYYSFHDEGKL